MISFFKKHDYLLPILSGLMLGFSWLPYGLPGLIFIAFIPILWYTLLSVQKSRKNTAFFLNTFLSFSIFNVITSWWVMNAGGIIGLLAPVLVNGTVMTFTMMVYKYLLKKHHKKYIGWSFLAVWLAMEYLHSLDWDLSWPWMFIGYSISEYNFLYQWYEWVGVRGGSFWIIGVNIGFYKWLLSKTESVQKIPNTPYVINTLFRLFVPITISLVMFFVDDDKGRSTAQVRIVQPNIDTYTDKFDESKYKSHKDLFYKLSFSEHEINPDLILLPETALPSGVWEDKIKNSGWIRRFKSEIIRFKVPMMIVGASTFRRIEGNIVDPPLSFRKLHDGSFYEAYNTAVCLTADSLSLYHKSRLVAGVEQLPFAGYMPFLKKLAIDLGGTSGVLGTQKERTVFKKDSLRVAPIICYESVYGEYLSEFIQNGANLIAIITNDGWWGNTAGHKQHFHYARIRAVENKRWIVRSANTGISGVIDEKGNVITSLQYDIDGVINHEVELISSKTFFSKYGDYIGRLSAMTALYFFLVAYVKKYREQRMIHP